MARRRRIRMSVETQGEKEKVRGGKWEDGVIRFEID